MQLRSLYKRLPEPDQHFIHLYVFEELSFDAIAEAMNTSVGAVYARKNRVRMKLLSMATAQRTRR